MTNYILDSIHVKLSPFFKDKLKNTHQGLVMWANNSTYSAGCKGGGGIPVQCKIGHLMTLLFQNTKYKKI